MPGTNECANFYCDNIPFGNRIRCANCRRSDINTCCDCDKPTTRRAVYCKDCKMNHRDIMLKVFHESRKADLPECCMCFQQLPNRRMIHCKGECHRIYTNLNQIVTRGRKYITN